MAPERAPPVAAAPPRGAAGAASAPAAGRRRGSPSAGTWGVRGSRCLFSPLLAEGRAVSPSGQGLLLCLRTDIHTEKETKDKQTKQNKRKKKESDLQGNPKHYSITKERQKSFHCWFFLPLTLVQKRSPNFLNIYIYFYRLFNCRLLAWDRCGGCERWCSSTAEI